MRAKGNSKFKGCLKCIYGNYIFPKNIEEYNRRNPRRQQLQFFKICDKKKQAHIVARIGNDASAPRPRDSKINFRNKSINIFRLNARWNASLRTNFIPYLCENRCFYFFIFNKRLYWNIQLASPFRVFVVVVVVVGSIFDSKREYRACKALTLKLVNRFATFWMVSETPPKAARLHCHQNCFNGGQRALHVQFCQWFDGAYVCRCMRDLKFMNHIIHRSILFIHAHGARFASTHSVRLKFIGIYDAINMRC